MTPQAETQTPEQDTVVRCQHCFSNLVNIKGHWLDGKTRDEYCIPISSGYTIPHKPLPKV